MSTCCALLLLRHIASPFLASSCNLSRLALFQVIRACAAKAHRPDKVLLWRGLSNCILAKSTAMGNRSKGSQHEKGRHLSNYHGQNTGNNGTGYSPVAQAIHLLSFTLASEFLYRQNLQRHKYISAQPRHMAIWLP